MNQERAVFLSPFFHDLNTSMEHSNDYSKNVLKKIDEDLQDSDQAIKNLKAHTEVSAIKTGKKLEYGKNSCNNTHNPKLNNTILWPQVSL